MIRCAIYARVSTDDKNQDPETQLFALREFCQKAEWEIVNEYVDKARAKDYVHRTAWAELKADAKSQQFKAVLVFRLDRAFRSVLDCQNTVTDWLERGIAFKSLKEDVIDTTTSTGKFMLTILAAVAELESNTISERVTAGIRRTRAEGNRYGRKRKYVNWHSVAMGLEAGETVSRLSKVLGYSRQLIYRAIEENRDGLSEKIALKFMRKGVPKT